MPTNKLSLIIFLVSAAIFLGGCSNNKEAKYNSCVESCKANKVCIKTSEIPTSLGIRPCAEYNTGDCINICTQKYK